MSTSSVSPELAKKEFDWKRLFIKAAGFGAGLAVVVCLVVGSWKWYSSRPKSPKPWNQSAVVATFSDLTTDRDGDLVFYYFVENRSKFDYQTSYETTAMFKESSGLRDGNGNIGLDHNIFIPSGTRVRVAIRLPGKDSDKQVWINPDEMKGWSVVSVEDIGPVKSQTQEEKAAERKRQSAVDTEYLQHPEMYVRSHMNGFQGFVVFDTRYRYQIDFPKSW